MEAQLIADDRLAHVPVRVRAVLAALKQELTAYYGDALQKVVLFGSYARGDFRDDSDIDLMPVVAGTSVVDLKREALFDIAYRHFEQDQLRVSIIPTLLQQYLQADSFLLMFVHKDGVEL